MAWASVTTAPGFSPGPRSPARYAAVTGRDVSALGYYMAFGCFKLAVVLEGIHARFLQHKTVGEGFEREGGGADDHRAGPPDAGRRRVMFSPTVMFSAEYRERITAQR